MPCLTCLHWRRADTVHESSKGLGHCQLDKELSHGHYHCPRHESAAANADTGGLTDDDIAWLRTNGDTPAGAELLRLYRLIDVPQGDPAARGIFQEALNRWHARLTGKETLRAGGIPRNLPENVACQAMITGAHDCGWPECRRECDPGFAKPLA